MNAAAELLGWGGGLALFAIGAYIVQADKWTGREVIGIAFIVVGLLTVALARLIVPFIG